MTSGLVDRIVSILRVYPNLTAGEIVARLADPAITRTSVNRVLYAGHSTFSVASATNPPTWALAATTSDSPPTIEASTATTPARPEPASMRRWQRSAYSEWKRHRGSGIVEAVGGAGKTALGLHALVEAVSAQTPVVVVVADENARGQWMEALEGVLPDCIVAQPTSTRSTSRPGWQVALLTPATVSRLRHIGPVDLTEALLVIDDIDRYAEGLLAHVLTEQFTARLALTRGIDHDDRAVRAQLIPYFGSVINGCDYAEAVAERLVDPVIVVHVAVPLSAQERARANQAQALIERQFDTLVGSYGAPQTGPEFRTFVDALSAGRGSGAHHANRYLAAISDRDKVLGNCQAKFDLVAALPVDVLSAVTTVVFTDRPAAAGRAEHQFGASGIRSVVATMTASPQQRAAIMADLLAGTLPVVIEPRVCDRALEVTAADIALMLSPHRDTHSLVHRLSQVVRADSATRPRLVIRVFAENTIEDPRDDDTADAATVHALAADTVHTDTTGLVTFLCDWFASNPPEGDRPRDNEVPQPSTTSPEPTEPDHAPAMPTSYSEFLAELAAHGNIGTGDEIGDLVGITEPREIRALAIAAADAQAVAFHEIGGAGEDLLLLGADVGLPGADLRAVAGRIARWAESAADPIGELHALVSALGGVHVPPHRLVQVAAFLRGTTPKALL